MPVLRNRRRSGGLQDPSAGSDNLQIVDAELSKGKFSFIYWNSFQKDIKVKQCIPLFSSRTTCESAIRALKRAFDVDESGTVSYNCAGGLKIVVKIPYEELELVKSHLLNTGKSETEATAEAYNQEIDWHGVVDGKHVHRALLELEISTPDPFQDFKWIVTVIEWQPISVLKAFARTRNMLQSSNVVKMTLYDNIYGIYEIAKEKAELSGDTIECYAKQRGRITQIADEFCGGSKYSKQTTRTLTGAALRIKPAALRMLGQIMTEENPSVARRVIDRTTLQTSGDEEVFDARAYKNLISTNTIRGATTFLNADAQDQVNALLKLKFGYEENDFKCFQASRLNKETERSMRARHQVHLMNLLMCREKWPDELSTIQKKLFFSSLFDSDLDVYDEKSDTILPNLIKEYHDRMPLEAGLRCRLYFERNRSQGSECTEDSENRQTTKENRNSRQDQSDIAVAEAEEQSSSECVQLCPLEQLKVNCMNVTLERYATDRHSCEEKFHLITGDPSQVQLNGKCKAQIDEIQADKYIRILKLILHAHGWIFLYTTAVDYAMWDKAFRANGFDPLDYPWLMIRDSDTVQENTSPIPQNIAELLIGARRKDDGVPEFQPVIRTAYKRAVSTRKRKFAIMDSCKEPRRRLKKYNTREALRTNQRSAEPMAEFLDTFCPLHGNVLDAFAGTMETARACVMTGRRCVALESEKMCFDIAFQGLIEHAAGYLADSRPVSTDPFTNGVTSTQTQTERSSQEEEPAGSDEISDE